VPSRRARSDDVESSGRERFDVAARELLEAVRSGTATTVPPEQLRLVFDWLAGTLMRSYGFADNDAADAAQDAIVSLLEVVGSGESAAHEIRNPAAYLTWLARNRAIDRFRRGHFETPRDLEPRGEAARGDDDERIAALLDRAASAAVIEEAMRAALDVQDALAVQVVTVWLDTAEELGKAPSSREVAKRSGVSHTSVNQALRRFRTYFPIPPAGTSED
jgi:RNA polymerase sigma factor (sigma-70 family)